MKKHLERLGTKTAIGIGALILLFAGTAVYAFMEHNTLTKTKTELVQTVETFTKKVTDLEAQIADVTEKNTTLESFLTKRAAAEGRSRSGQEAQRENDRQAREAHHVRSGASEEIFQSILFERELFPARRCRHRHPISHQAREGHEVS